MNSINEITLTVEYGKEADGRFMADIGLIPGAMAWGTDKDEAARKAVSIALKTIADEIEQGQHPVHDIDISVSLIHRNAHAAKKFPHYKIDDLLAQTDFEAIANDEYMKDWRTMPPVGRELE
ncbi:MAG: hypothetical protein LBV79_00135 [Candidatus Adiutrix sp.]|jgi:predicted RNase H-like HicB family nuclease|nr:hypothetical protein [Candidatus Adiutrix sp.]